MRITKMYLKWQKKVEKHLVKPIGGTNIFLQTQMEQGTALFLQSLLLDLGNTI